MRFKRRSKTDLFARKTRAWVRNHLCVTDSEIDSWDEMLPEHISYYVWYTIDKQKTVAKRQLVTTLQGFWVFGSMDILELYLEEKVNVKQKYLTELQSLKLIIFRPSIATEKLQTVPESEIWWD